jgi:hypothetical protein
MTEIKVDIIKAKTQAQKEAAAEIEVQLAAIK